MTTALSMPKLRKTGKAAFSTGVLTAANVFIVSNIYKRNPELANPLALAFGFGVPILGVWLSRRYPTEGAAIAGAGLATIFTALLANATGDLSLAAINPEQERKFKNLQQSNLGDFSEAMLAAMGV